MSLTKDYMRVVTEAEKQGFKRDYPGRGSRDMHNLIADLRKSGFKWKGR